MAKSSRAVSSSVVALADVGMGGDPSGQLVEGGGQ